MLEMAHLLQLSASLHLSFRPPFSHSNRCKIVSAYICISLVVNLVEHLHVLTVCLYFIAYEMPILSVAQGGAPKSRPTIESLSISLSVCFMHYEATLLGTHI